MNKENQNTEWKESWRDEYLRWICGFANAQGGVLFIGKNDKGVVSGINDAGKLLEEIPNKVRDILGIIVDVNLLAENEKEYIEIITEAYPYPISYKGQYHYRSGSTKQELKGAALDKFLLQKQGKRWEGVPVPNVGVTDLSEEAFTQFRHRANRSKRLEVDILQESNAVLLDKLHLVEGKYLKRASLLLFHPDPEKFVTGAFIKIGYFKSDTNLIFQDEIHGHLFNQVNKTLDLLLTKYLRATIRYEGVGRIEEYPYPENALREALLNAIAHKDYSSGIPIQIRVYDDKLSIWNSTQLPEDWTIKRLSEIHSSQPYNPSIANCFFRAGFVESWGRGTLEIIRECVEYGIPEPTFTFDSGVWIEFKAKEIEIMSGKSSEKSSVKSSEKILTLISENEFITIAELSEIVNITTRGVEKQIKKSQNS